MNYLLKNEIDQSEIISFDIFDTLLIRMVNRPSDIFFIVGEVLQKQNRISVSHFKEKRIDAEKKAQKKSLYGEVTLDAIYDSFESLNSSDKEKAKTVELEIESIYLRANPEIIKIYQYCIESGKRIIAISDMYLSSGFLKECLSDNGFNINEVFVSCEFNTNKRNTKLYSDVAKKLGVKKTKIVHIGNSFKSDFLGARKAGLMAFYLPRERNKQGDNISEEIAYNNAVNGHIIKDYYSDIGYSVLGPILLGFSLWLYNKFEQGKYDNILFLSRDGKIMKLAYDALFPNNNSAYFHISRKAINVVMLWDHPEFEQLVAYTVDTPITSIRIFLNRIGIIYDGPNQIDGLNIDKEYQSENFWKSEQIKHLYETRFKQKAIENSKAQYKLFKEYLKKFAIGSKVAIVDIGWRGSMQKRLNEFFASENEYNNVKIDGYYIGIENNTSGFNGYLYNSQGQTAEKDIIDAGVGLFESLFLADEGSTAGYMKQRDSVIPVLEEYEITDQHTEDNIRLLHKAAIEYVNELKKQYIKLLPTPQPAFCLSFFERLACHPSKNDLKELGSLIFNDTKNVALITKNGLIYYIKNFNDLKLDYHVAPWKIGFLKENVTEILDWGTIYEFVKRIVYNSEKVK